MNRIIELANEVQSKFKGFYLAGGTAIMFKYRHRISNDLDFFNQKVFSYNLHKKKVLGNFNVDRWFRGDENIDFFIEGIKVSFVFFPFPNIRKTQVVQNITMASDMDLFLNKIYTAGRRIDRKDPFDAAYLYRINRWKPEEIKQLFEKKFSFQSYEIYLGALLSFDDYNPLENWVKETLNELIAKI